MINPKLKNKLKNKYLWISIGVLILGVMINQSVSFYLESKYEELPVLNDAILDVIPYYNLVWLFDLLWIISTVSFGIYAYKKKKNWAFIILVFGLSQMLRGLFIGMTPFGSPKINTVGLFNGSAFRMGVYPSGHTGTSYLAFLLSEGFMRYVFLALSVAVMVFLLLARGHYSVDIFSAIIFNYAICVFSRKYFSKFMDEVEDGSKN